MGKMLGSGDNAVVYEATKNGTTFAMKLIKRNTKSMQQEISIHKEAAALGCAPKIFADFGRMTVKGRTYARALIMEIIRPFNTADTTQMDIIQRCYILLQNGIIHNDLHQGNVGVRLENGEERGIIFDFGEAERIAPPTDKVVLRQLLVAQLYALLTDKGCNYNNTLSLCGDAPIHDAIYLIRAHTKKSLSELNKLLGDDIDPRSELELKL